MCESVRKCWRITTPSSLQIFLSINQSSINVFSYVWDYLHMLGHKNNSLLTSQALIDNGKLKPSWIKGVSAVFLILYLYTGSHKNELPDFWTGPGRLRRSDQIYQVFHSWFQSQQSHCIWRLLWRNAGCLVPHEISKCCKRVKKKLKSSKQAWFLLSKFMCWLLLLYVVAQI